MSQPSDEDRYTYPPQEQTPAAGQPEASPPRPPAGSAPAGSADPFPPTASAGPGTPAPGQSSPTPGQSYASAGGAAPSQQSRSGEGVNFFRAMFDLKFDHYITAQFSSFLYVVAIVVAILAWIGQIVFGIMLGILVGSMGSIFGEPTFNPLFMVLAILFGWIPSVISLIAMRLGLEFSVATVRTAQNTKRIAEAQGA